MSNTEKNSRKGYEIVFKCIFALLAVIYIFAVLKVTVLTNGVRQAAEGVRFAPFNGIARYKAEKISLQRLALNYLGNVALFFPLGIFLPLFFKKMKFWLTVVTGAGLSLAIEVAQHFLVCGYSDVDDLIMNVIGTALGAVVYLFILNGRKKTVLSYILSLLLIISVEAGAAGAVWYMAPELLPSDMIVAGGMIAGERLDGYDVRLVSDKMSHGEVFFVHDTSEDRDGNRIKSPEGGSYYFTDSAKFVIQDSKDGKGKYHIAGIDEIIAAVSDGGGSSYVRLWLDGDGKCEMVLLEKK